MLYSIIIPVFNAELYLRKCIESVLNQEHEKYEIILINDGSIDNSGIICEEYKDIDKRIKVVHQTNQGQTMARNKGLSLASGDYILFLDSDDFWDNNLLKKINKILVNCSYDILLFKYRKVNDSGVYLYEQPKLFRDSTEISKGNMRDMVLEIARDHQLNNLTTKVIKSSLIREKDYYDIKDMITSEDLAQSLLYFYRAENIFYINQAFYNYRFNRNSITNTFNENKIRDRFLMSDMKKDFFKKINHWDYEVKKMHYNNLLNLIISYISELFVKERKMTLNQKKVIVKEITQHIEFKKAIKYNDKYEELDINKKYILCMIKKESFTVLNAYLKTIYKIAEVTGLRK